MSAMIAERSSSQDFASDEARWKAIIDRNRAADGAFFFSVRTTGIYCRPSCGARLPRRQNVAFHASAAEAEAAGFRACLRCKPNLDRSEDAQAKAVARACRAIEAAEELPTLEALAKMVGQSPWHFHRVLKPVPGVTQKVSPAAHRGNRGRNKLKPTNTGT